MARKNSDGGGKNERKRLEAGVKDASAFLFEAAGGPVAFGPISAEPALAERPHFHDHRQRLRQRFEEAGAGGLADYELLELFLFRTIPRRDTKPLAKALLKKFGDLPAVLAAPALRIAEVDGAGPAVAQDLKVLQALISRSAKAEIRQRPVVSSWSALLNYCTTSMAHAPREQFRVLFLDVKNQLIGDEVLNEGTIDHAPVYPREIARRALELASASVILVHNHPTDRFSITADHALSH